MRRATILPAAALALLATVCVSQRTEAQALAQRVRAAGDGVAELRYATRPGVCGNGTRGFSMGRHSYFGEWNGNDMRDMRPCVPGARVRLRVERGTVTDVSVAVGQRPSSSTSTGEERRTDLGDVSSTEAAAYFLGLADTAATHVAKGAITAAVIADSASVWQRLFAIATDTSRASSSTRRDAMFWVSRFAAAKVTGHGEDIAAADDDDQRDDREDARDAAVFALSQLRGRQGVEPLMEIARSHKDPQLRQKAIFWLGQSGDRRAALLFREILKG
jgi:HEAT repeat protein